MAEEQVIPQEQLLAQLRTRGFESGGFASPLREFRGRLDKITGSMVQRGQMKSARLEVTYTFSEVEVIKSTEPYPFPIAQISLLHSNRAQSMMGVLGASIDKVINSGLDDNAPQNQVKNQDFLIGKVQQWEITPSHMMWDMDKKQETPRECWEVIEVEGFATTPVVTKSQASPTPITPSTITPAQEALNLLEGKTLSQWNNEVFKNSLVKAGGGDLINSIIQGTFVSSLEAAGNITKDANGVYHVKKA